VASAERRQTAGEFGPAESAAALTTGSWWQTATTTLPGALLLGHRGHCDRFYASRFRLVATTRRRTVLRSDPAVPVLQAPRQGHVPDPSGHGVGRDDGPDHRARVRRAARWRRPRGAGSAGGANALDARRLSTRRSPSRTGRVWPRRAMRLLTPRRGSPRSRPTRSRAGGARGRTGVSGGADGRARTPAAGAPEPARSNMLAQVPAFARPAGGREERRYSCTAHVSSWANETRPPYMSPLSPNGCRVVLAWPGGQECFFDLESKSIIVGEGKKGEEEGGVQQLTFRTRCP
jgi:hypothetical protein